MSARKKQPRVHLTHFEIRRGSTLRLRLAVNDEALAEVGDELGALFRKIAPGAVMASVPAPEATTTPSSTIPGAIEVVEAAGPREIFLAPEHTGDDAEYHASLRSRLAELFGSLCNSALTDALEIARDVQSRRADGGN